MQSASVKMGRLERLRKKRHKKHRKEAQTRRPKAAGSDPEPSLRTEEQDSSCTNSCGEDTPTLCASSSSLPKCVDALGGTTAGGPPRIPADEVEVMHKLSCLNFSVLPCDTMQHPQDQEAGVAMEGNFDVLSDVEPYSEMT